MREKNHKRQEAQNECPYMSWSYMGQTYALFGLHSKPSSSLFPLKVLLLSQSPVLPKCQRKAYLGLARKHPWKLVVEGERWKCVRWQLFQAKVTPWRPSYAHIHKDSVCGQFHTEKRTPPKPNFIRGSHFWCNRVGPGCWLDEPINPTARCPYPAIHVSQSVRKVKLNINQIGSWAKIRKLLKKPGVGLISNLIDLITIELKLERIPRWCPEGQLIDLNLN